MKYAHSLLYFTFNTIHIFPQLQVDARNNIRKILDTQSVSFGRSECTVRVNSVESGLCDEDLVTILSASNLPSSILLPKIDFVDHLQWVGFPNMHFLP
jgi:citrate lyase subunit beta-like protein